jgi:hypothetical protein
MYLRHYSLPILFEKFFQIRMDEQTNSCHEIIQKIKILKENYSQMIDGDGFRVLDPTLED